MSKAQVYLKYLQSEGYTARIDGDGDVLIEWDGLNLILFGAEDDPMFFSLMIPNFWSIDSELERLYVYEAICRASRRIKVMEVFAMSNNHVSAALEMLLMRPEDIAHVFPRCLQTIKLLQNTWKEIMEESAKEVAPRAYKLMMELKEIADAS